MSSRSLRTSETESRVAQRHALSLLLLGSALLGALFFIAAAIPGCSSSSSSGGGVYGLTSREVVPSLAFPTGVPTVGDVAIIRAFPSLLFSEPLFLAAPPDGTDRIFVVEKGGTIRVFPNDDGITATSLFLDIDVRSDGEQGLLGLAFSPDFATDGEFYVYYTAPSGPRRSVVSRFTVSAGDPDIADPGSEEIILEVAQPYSNHNAGMLAFGPDDLLYVALGDGGSGGDPHWHGQDLTTLLGSLLRIDPSGGTPYAIPADNPFVGAGGGVREEIWAYGLRNPWRFSFDRDTGELWLGDVGQGSREEIDVVSAGDNLGWRLFEGILPFLPVYPLPSDLRAPVLDYGEADGQSVTGGYVSRGSGVPSLAGVYVYGDYVSGRVWGLVRSGGQVIENTRIGTVPAVASFGEDEAGELFAVSLLGTIWRFAEAGPPPPPPAVPLLLSETGIFADLATLEAAPGVIEYAVRTGEWADGARSRRWIFLPGLSRIAFDETGRWTFPPGAVFVQHLEIEEAGGAIRRIETRVLVQETGAWRAYPYRWDAAGLDAALDLDGEAIALTVPTASGPLAFDWHVPTEAECVACHSAAAGPVLGIRTDQMNRDFDYPLVGDNQLRSWDHIGLFTTPLAAPAAYPALPDPADPAEEVETRARVLLDVNCAACHRPGGGAPGSLDLRLATPLAAMQAIGVLPSAGDLGIPGALIITPGDPAMSILHERMVRLDAARMPPPSQRVDASASGTVAEWIDGL